MKHCIPFILLVLFLLPFGMGAQDMNWTLYNFSPLSVNPASTGNFYGTYRVNGLVRTADFTHENNINGSTTAYNSFSVNLDAPLALGFRKQDWIGVGGMFFGDGAGTLNMGLSYSLLSVAYHFSLNKKQTKVFTIGVQGGSGSRSLKDFDAAVFEDGTMNGFVPNNMGEIDNKGFFDFNFGIGYRAQVNKTTSVNFGATANQLSFAETALLPKNNAQTKRDSGFTTRPFGFGLHGDFNFILNKKWDLRPGFRVQTMGPATETQFNAMLGYLFNKEKETTLRFGLGYRVGDALQVLLGADVGNVQFALAYDLSLSQVSGINNRQGGLELGVTYIGKIYPEPKIKPVILCPRY